MSVTQAMRRIMYICTDCADGYPEGCGYYDRNDLRVMPDGRWLCDGCHDNIPPNRGDPDAEKPFWSSLPIPPEYGPVAAIAAAEGREP